MTTTGAADCQQIRAVRVALAPFHTQFGCSLLHAIRVSVSLTAGRVARRKGQRVIRSFGDQRTQDVFHGHATREVKRLDGALVKATVRKLDMMVAAAVVQDLRAPPGNRLEALSGDLDGWFSIRVNDLWRLIFRWLDGAAVDVKLVDYH